VADARKWKRLRLESRELLHAVRTTLAVVASLLVARLFRLPESYWAAITSLIVMQSTLGAAWTISKQRLAGTALGAALGTLFVTYVASDTAGFGAGVFLCGVICALLRIERNAFRYAGITLAIIMLIARTSPSGLSIFTVSLKFRWASPWAWWSPQSGPSLARPPLDFARAKVTGQTSRLSSGLLLNRLPQGPCVEPSCESDESHHWLRCLPEGGRSFGLWRIPI